MVTKVAHLISYRKLSLVGWGQYIFRYYVVLILSDDVDKS